MQDLAGLFRGDYPSAVYLLESDLSVEHIREKADQAGLQFFHLDGTTISNKAGFYAVLKSTMHFPEGTGNNWDAMSDRLGDLSWLLPVGCVILYASFQCFAQGEPENFSVAYFVFQEAATIKEAQWPFYVLYRGDKAFAPLEIKHFD